jgi:hypothetical protein
LAMRPALALRGADFLEGFAFVLAMNKTPYRKRSFPCRGRAASLEFVAT